MKKTFLATILMALCTPIVFFSCGDDEDEPKRNEPQKEEQKNDSINFEDGVWLKEGSDYQAIGFEHNLVCPLYGDTSVKVDIYTFYTKLSLWENRKCWAYGEVGSFCEYQMCDGYFYTFYRDDYQSPIPQDGTRYYYQLDGDTLTLTQGDEVTKYIRYTGPEYPKAPVVN